MNLNKPFFLTNPDNQKYIISVENISNKTKTILLILILYGIFILEKWAKENDFDKDILLVISTISYSNDKLAL